MPHIPRPRDGKNEDDDAWADEDAPDHLKPQPKKKQDDDNKEEGK